VLLACVCAWDSYQGFHNTVSIKDGKCQNEGHSHYLTEALGLKMCCFYIYMTFPCTVLLGIYFGKKIPATQEKPKRRFWGGEEKGREATG
jgi:hypothetical protein